VNRSGPAFGAALLLGLLLPCPASPDEAPSDGRLGHDVMPTFEAVDLSLDARKPDYSGTVRIELDVRHPVRSFRFHSEGSTLNRVTLDRGGKSIPITHRELRMGLWEVSSEAPIPAGAGTLTIAFTNELDTHASGLYRLKSNGDDYTFTQFEANDAREAFPCFDEPEFKIPWQVTLTIPRDHLGITNTPIEKEMQEGESKRIVYRRTPPLPAYLLAIATGPFDTVDIPGMSVPGRVVTPHGLGHLAAHAVHATPALLKGLEGYFGRPYPYAKLDLVAVPEFWYGAMENAGAIVFIDNALLLPEDAGLAQQRRMVSIVSHELAHMWFGDLVTMAWWDDLWLNESFATWMGQKIANQAFPEFGFDLVSMEGVDRAKLADARASTRSIRQPVSADINLNQLADALAYNKGHAVLDMFEQWLTPSVFQKGIREYLQANAWKNATAADLWAALSRASGKDVGTPMATFLEQPGMPLVSVTRDGPRRVTLTQRRFANEGVEVESALWQIPVTLRYSDGGKSRMFPLLLTQPSQTVDLPGTGTIDWIYPNADELAYYRWELPGADMDRLASQGTAVLTARERRGFLFNLQALLDAGRVHGDAYLATLPKLAGDPEPQVIEALLEALDRARKAFWTPSTSPAFGRYVQRTLETPVRRFGFEAQPGESETIRLLRPGLMLRMARLGRDQVAIAQGESLTDAYMREPDLVDPTLVPNALLIAAIRGDRARFDGFRERFETTKIPTERAAMLAAMSSFGADSLADAALDYALHGPLRPQEVGRVPGTMLEVPGREDKVFDWVRANYDAIVARMPDIHRERLATLSIGCTAQRVEQLKAFFSEPAHRPLGIEVALDKAVATTSDCATLREREGPAVANYLDGLVGAN
jgi:aminopeptidase N